MFCTFPYHSVYREHPLWTEHEHPWQESFKEPTVKGEILARASAESARQNPTIASVMPSWALQTKHGPDVS